MKIKKIKFSEEGSSGFKVSYSSKEIRTLKLPNGKENVQDVLVDHETSYRLGVQQEVKNLLGDLKILGVRLLELDADISNFDLKFQGVSVKYGTDGIDGFVLTLTYRTTYGMFITTNTPYINKSVDTDCYAKVVSLLELLFKEIADYVQHKKSVSGEQLLLSFAEEKNMDKDVLEEMDDEMKEAYIQEYLAKKGAILITPADVLDEEDENDPNQLDLEEEAKKAEAEQVPVEEEKPVPTKKKGKAGKVVKLEKVGDDEDGFGDEVVNA